MKLEAFGLRSLTAVAMIAGLGLATVAEAATCPSSGVLDPPTVDRIVDVDGPTPPPGTDSAVCYAYGEGNINGNINQDPILNGQTTGGNTFILDSSQSTVLLPPDVAFVEQNTGGASAHITSTLGQSGTFSVTQVVAGAPQLIAGLKFGSGSGNPDWFAFIIPNVLGTYAYSFSAGDANGLSHISLYSAVPLPASLLLMLAGVGGLGFVGWRRRTA